MQLPKSVTSEIDHWLTKFPADQPRSAVIAGLLKAQEHNNGWLSDEIMNAVAEYLIIPAVEVFEVAILFIIFDLETAYLFPWALALRSVGWPGFAAMLVFLGVLLIGFVYEWRTGALEWE